MRITFSKKTSNYEKLEELENRQKKIFPKRCGSSSNSLRIGVDEPKKVP